MVLIITLYKKINPLRLSTLSAIGWST